MRRKGFTIVELLIVILIIGTLVAILLPAIAGAIRTTKRAAVSADIQSLNQSLLGYATARGPIPPSIFWACEDGDYSNRNGAIVGGSQIDNARVRTMAFLRQAFGKVKFGSFGPVPIPGIGFFDFNGNGKLDPPYLLSGDECLVFFLGGVPKPIVNTDGSIDYGMIGLTNDPTNPWQPDIYTIAGNTFVPPRSVPYFEFRGARLVDVNGNGMPSYGDAQTGAPYAYFARVGGSGYDPNDCNFANEPSGDPSPVAAFYMVGLGTAGIQTSVAPNPYTETPVLPAVPYQTATMPNPIPPINISWIGSSFQIISAGNDKQFGPGGWYAAKSDAKLPWPAAANFQATSVNMPTDVRNVERDNITNFSQGPLQ